MPKYNTLENTSKHNSAQNHPKMFDAHLEFNFISTYLICSSASQSYNQYLFTLNIK